MTSPMLPTQEERLRRCREIICGITTEEQYREFRKSWLGGYGASDYVVVFLDIMAEFHDWEVEESK